MAKRRKGEALEPADLQLYFERTWWVCTSGISPFFFSILVRHELPCH